MRQQHGDHLHGSLFPQSSHLCLHPRGLLEKDSMSQWSRSKKQLTAQEKAKQSEKIPDIHYNAHFCTGKIRMWPTKAHSYVKDNLDCQTWKDQAGWLSYKNADSRARPHIAVSVMAQTMLDCADRFQKEKDKGLLGADVDWFCDAISKHQQALQQINTFQEGVVRSEASVKAGMKEVMSFMRGMAKNEDAKSFVMDLVSVGVRMIHCGRQLLEWMTAAEDPVEFAKAVGYTGLQPCKKDLEHVKKARSRDNPKDLLATYLSNCLLQKNADYETYEKKPRDAHQRKKIVVETRGSDTSVNASSSESQSDSKNTGDDTETPTGPVRGQRNQDNARRKARSPSPPPTRRGKHTSGSRLPTTSRRQKDPQMDMSKVMEALGQQMKEQMETMVKQTLASLPGSTSFPSTDGGINVEAEIAADKHLGISAALDSQQALEEEVEMESINLKDNQAVASTKRKEKAAGAEVVKTKEKQRKRPKESSEEETVKPDLTATTIDTVTADSDPKTAPETKKKARASKGLDAEDKAEEPQEEGKKRKHRTGDEEVPKEKGKKAKKD